MRIGVECGGTFTDLIVLDDDGRLAATDKVFSAPAELARAVTEALAKLPVAIVQGARLLHRSIVATNALIEWKGVQVGLLVARGFLDIVFLQRQDPVRMYDLKPTKPEPLVRREDVFEVTERLSVVTISGVAMGIWSIPAFALMHTAVPVNLYRAVDVAMFFVGTSYGVLAGEVAELFTPTVRYTSIGPNYHLSGAIGGGLASAAATAMLAAAGSTTGVVIVCLAVAAIMVWACLLLPRSNTAKIVTPAGADV
ncbi:hydantoinase/oxoprolinase N-terminal domain-containing protein [Arthrobacter sp. GCM10027362]|uniref:hydantoinase/oxoprolinase N-terminal domain-containing protein n=1 Tax=Arthrobacter sp. GCM10027362 TaxID=3273379 RepID=UPI00363AF6F0